MEGHRVISFKKVLLHDVKDEQDQKVETSLQPEVEEIPSSPITFDVVELSRSPVSDDVMEIPCSPSPGEVVELLSEVENDNEEISSNELLTNNDSNAPKGNDKSKAQFVPKNSIQPGIFNTSNKLYKNNNGHIQIEALENYLKSSPNDSCCVISDSDDCTEIPISSESGDESENADPPAIGSRSVRAVSNKDSIEEHIYYICPQCGVDCGPIDKWKLHTEAEHGFGSLETANFECSVNKKGNLCHKCRDCSKTVHIGRGFYTLLLHRISHHLPFNEYMACRICSMKYKYKQTLRRHLKRVHEELFKNTKPDGAFEYIRFFCSVCKEQQMNKLEWESHMEIQHNYFRQAHSNFKHLRNNIYICRVCKTEVREVRSGFVEHMQKHDEFNSFVCKNCNFSSAQMRSVLRHVRLKHLRTPKELELECVLCKATFKSSGHRNKHYKIKHQMGNQSCKVCKKTFVSSSFLLSHIISANHLAQN